MGKHYIDWGEIDSLIFRLMYQIKESGLKFKNIYGVPRGGLIPAVILSHKLNIPLVKGDIGPDTLVIDDICDSGETLDKLVKNIKLYIHFPLNLKQQFYIINLILHVLSQLYMLKNGIKMFG